jgi:hypothetical protein
MRANNFARLAKPRPFSGIGIVKDASAFCWAISLIRVQNFRQPLTPTVIPAEAGIQWETARNTVWIPASAGMTIRKFNGYSGRFFP